jgi:transcriptional regulator with XRE-family HTH domain
MRIVRPIRGSFVEFHWGNDSMSCEPAQVVGAAQSGSDDSGSGRGGGRIADANKATGQRIRLARKWAGLNQDEVATRMGLSRASVSNWELGQGIKRENLVGFAQVAGVSAEWLLTGEPTLAPKGEKASDPATALEIDVAQLERLTAAAFELLGKPLGQSQELAKAILKASVRPRSGAREPQDDALTKRLAQFLIQMYAP